MSIKKAETTRISIVLLNETLQKIEFFSKKRNLTKSEMIRIIIDDWLFNVEKNYNINLTNLEVKNENNSGQTN